MNGDEIRRSQLVGTFGVGSIKADVNNISMICAGLDHWYKYYTRFSTSLEVEEKEEEYKIYDKRLEKFLDVDFFKEPPEWKQTGANRYTPVPYLRFPTYMFCTNNRSTKQCGKLFKKQPQDPAVRIDCPVCNFKLIQVNLVVSCRNGHIDEFPWFEWAHVRKKATSECNDQRDMKLLQLGGTGVKGQVIQCNVCKASEDLDAGYFVTNSASKLNMCSGRKPWLGINEKESCDLQVKGYFSTEPSLYQPILKTSLFLPTKTTDVTEELEVEFSQNPQIKHDIKTFEQDWINKPVDQIINIGIPGLLALRKGKILNVLSDFNEEEIKSALLKRVAGSNESNNKTDEPENDIEFKLQEYEAITKLSSNKYFKLQNQDLNLYSDQVKNAVDQIILVNSMLQTKALVGFTRNSPTEVDYKKARSLMWKKQPSLPDRWLPAIQNYAEGIFIKFNKNLFSTNNELVKKRISYLQKLQENLDGGVLKEVNLSKELLTIHTISHLLIKNLSFDAGYGAASIGERLYVDPKLDMYGVLIYTAQGDAEGTMGGLVGSGYPDRFDNLFSNSLRQALWCSTDPVCNEIIPKGFNLGACYSCTLLPETSCEILNSFLDRGVVVGTQNEPELGYLRPT